MPADDVNSFLKKYDLNVPGAAKDTGAPGAAKASTPAPSAPEEPQTTSATGALRSFAGTATGIPRAINAGIGYFAPGFSEKLGTLAERIPGVKRMEDFAAEPNADWKETEGYVGAELMQMFTGAGELKYLAKAVQAAKAAPVAAKAAEEALPFAKFTAGKGFEATGAAAPARAIDIETEGAIDIPGKFKGKGRPFAKTAETAKAQTPNIPGEFVTGQSFVPHGPPASRAPSIKPKFTTTLPGTFETGRGFVNDAVAPGTLMQRAERAVKTGLKNAVIGAAAGAGGNTSDPGSSALAGAAGGVAGPVMGRFLQSRIGRYLTEFGLGSAMGYQVYHALRGEGFNDSMVERMLAEGVLFSILRRHNSPLIRSINERIGAGAARVARPLRRIDPRIGGAAAGQTEGAIDNGD